MCDLQILSGMCILVSGYILLPCGLSAFHWSALVSLAWFASNTHLSGLMALRQYLNCYRWEWYTRIVLVLAFLILLLAAIIPTLFFHWQVRSDLWWYESTMYPSSPAICFYNAKLLVPNSLVTPFYGTEHPHLTSVVFQQGIYSMLLLTYGFVTRFCRLSKPATKFLATRLKRPLKVLSQRCLARLQNVSRGRGHNAKLDTRLAWEYFVVLPVLAGVFLVRIHVDLFGSMVFEVRRFHPIILRKLMNSRLLIPSVIRFRGYSP